MNIEVWVDRLHEAFFGAVKDDPVTPSRVPDDMVNYTVFNDEVVTRMVAYDHALHRARQVFGNYDLMSFRDQTRVRRALLHSRPSAPPYYGQPDLRVPFTQVEIDSVRKMVNGNSILLSDEYGKVFGTA